MTLTSRAKRNEARSWGRPFGRFGVDCLAMLKRDAKTIESERRTGAPSTSSPNGRHGRCSMAPPTNCWTLIPTWRACCFKRSLHRCAISRRFSTTDASVLRLRMTCSFGCCNTPAATPRHGSCLPRMFRPELQAFDASSSAGELPHDTVEPRLALEPDAGPLRRAQIAVLHLGIVGKAAEIAKYPRI